MARFQGTNLAIPQPERKKIAKSRIFCIQYDGKKRFNPVKKLPNKKDGDQKETQGIFTGTLNASNVKRCPGANNGAIITAPRTEKNKTKIYLDINLFEFHIFRIFYFRGSCPFYAFLN